MVASYGQRNLKDNLTRIIHNFHNYKSIVPILLSCNNLFLNRSWSLFIFKFNKINTKPTKIDLNRIREHLT